MLEKCVFDNTSEITWVSGEDSWNFSYKNEKQVREIVVGEDQSRFWFISHRYFILKLNVLRHILNFGIGALNWNLVPD